MARHPMTPVDAAWYHMDGPANRAIVVSITTTTRPVSFERVRTEFAARLLRFDRFRQRVVESGLVLPNIEWEDVEIDIDHHVRHAALPAPHDDAALRALVDDLAGQALDPTRPLWQTHVVERYKGGSALITRYHHCIADGTAMMTVAQTLFDLPPGVSAQSAHGRLSLAEPASDWSGKLGLVLRGTGSLLTELVKWPDPRSPFKGDFGAAKRVAWSEPVPIDDVKAIGARACAKVNDVLVAAAAGALRAYLRRQGVDVNHTTLRAMVPVDLRPRERLGQLGNEFGLVILDLPVSTARRTQRLALTKTRMDALKHSPEASAMEFLFDIFGRGPKVVEDLASVVFGSKTSVVMTNVAGPREGISMLGAPVDRMMFCVPHPGTQLGMGISIMSYRGMATLTVIADAALVPDPQAITEGFNREFDALRDGADARSGSAQAGASRAKRPAHAAAPAKAKKAVSARAARARHARA